MNKWKNISLFAFLLRTESKPELVKTEMGPPPSPASTCSDTSSIASSASLPYSKLARVLPFFFSTFTLSCLFGNHLLTLVPGAKAHNQFFHSVLSRVLWHWNRWCSGFHQHIIFMFLINVFLWSDYSKLEFSAIYLAAGSLFSIAYSLKLFVYLVLTEKHYNVTLLFRNLYIFVRLI